MERIERRERIEKIERVWGLDCGATGSAGGWLGTESPLVESGVAR